MMYTVIAGNVW